MSFLAPMAFFFAAVLPVVVLFYLLKRRRVVRLISSTVLWQKFLTDTQASAPFQKLQRNWLLFLQLLLLALIIFALARPYLTGSAGQSRLRVMILDASASMQSTDVKPTRFEAARQEALKWVEGLRDEDQMVVLLAAAQTEVKQSATSDKGALRRALQTARVTDAPSRMEEALKLAETLTRDRTDAEIHLFSDGAVRDLGEFENENLPLVYHRVGERGENAGIISMDLRAHPEDPSQRAIFASVRNYKSEPMERVVEVRFNGELVDARVVTLPETNTVPLVFVLPQTNDGVFQLNLTGEDDLAVDDEVTAVSLMARPTKALLVTQGNRFLEKALRGAGQLDLEVRTGLADPAEDFDVVILDDLVPVVWPAGSTLSIHVTRTNWFPTWETVSNPPIVSWKTTHPLMRFVNMDNVEVGEALRVGPPTWGETLVESSQTPLIVAGEVERRRLIWVGFDSLRSTWPFRLSFPIFIANAMQWLSPSAAGANQWAVQAGQAFRLALREPVETVLVTHPDGRKVERPISLNQRELVFGDTLEAGLYTLQAGTNQVRFAANLLDASESQTQPRETLPLGHYARVEATSLRTGNTELWRWLAVAGLAVLLWEWWYYHRRTA